MKPSRTDRVPRAFHIPIDRRRFFKSMALASAGFGLRGYLAEALTVTPQVTQGPFYPLAKNIPLDKDNDLVQLDDHTSLANGIVTYVTGRVLDINGNPIRGALVELWHADQGGNYLYSSSAVRNPAFDPNFAGFGQFLTGADGGYKFRTIKAGLYQGRTRHFHFGITVPGQLTRSTTQLFWNEVPRDLNGNVWGTMNSNDMVLSGITNAAQRASVIKDFTPVPGTTTGEVETSWDIVMGVTPMEPAYPAPGGLVLGGQSVAGPSGAARYKITIPAYAKYSYEVYGNPTMGNLSWSALPFSLTQSGALDRNIYKATAEGLLDIYVEAKAVKDFYYVSFRAPGANTGTP